MPQGQKDCQQGGKASVQPLGFGSKGIQADSKAADMMRNNAVRGEVPKDGIVSQLQSHGAKKPF